MKLKCLAADIATTAAAELPKYEAMAAMCKAIEDYSASTGIWY